MSKPGVWEPNGHQEVAAKVRPEHWALLCRLAEATSGDDSAQAAEQVLLGLDAGSRAALAAVMRLPEAAWRVADELENDRLEALIRLFTLGEMRFDGWQAGKRSPVIALVKLLRRRGAFDAELRKWIKANTDNRYLPNGAVL